MTVRSLATQLARYAVGHHHYFQLLESFGAGRRLFSDDMVPAFALPGAARYYHMPGLNMADAHQGLPSSTSTVTEAPRSARLAARRIFSSSRLRGDIAGHDAAAAGRDASSIFA